MAASHSVMVTPAAESTDQATELLWQDAMTRLSSTNNEILLPANIVESIGQGNVTKIKARLCALLNTPVVGFVDDTLNAFRIMRSPSFSGSAGSASALMAMPNVADAGCKESPASIKGAGKTASDSKTSKVPRPPNAFILYRQHYHPIMKEEHPEYRNNDISIILGKQWKAETDEVKAHYKSLADDIKRKHAEDHPNYQYAPRKPSEKKRRAPIRRSGHSFNNAPGSGQTATQVAVSAPPVLAPQPNAVTSAPSPPNVSPPGPAAPVASSSVVGQNNNVPGNGVGFNFGGNGTMTVSLPIATQMAAAANSMIGTYLAPGVHPSISAGEFEDLDLDYLLDDFPPAQMNFLASVATIAAPAAIPHHGGHQTPHAPNHVPNHAPNHATVANPTTANNSVDVDLEDYVNM